MAARKLEVVANIFSMNKNILGNIRKAVADVGIEIYDIYPNLLSASEWSIKIFISYSNWLRFGYK